MSALALAQAHIETLAQPLPQPQAGELALETLAQPLPGTDVAQCWIEVVRRDSAAAASVARAFDAFAHRAWPTAQRAVFAFAHDWAEPLVERLEWHTQVARLASGNEVRQALRLLPRRSLRYHLGHASAHDALLADWLADFAGRPALWPLPQYGLLTRHAVPAGALALPVRGAQAAHYSAPAAAAQLREEGLHTPPVDQPWVLAGSADGWQALQMSALQGDWLMLAQPLARDLPAASPVLPLAWGVCSEPAAMQQLIPGAAAAEVQVQLHSAALGGLEPGETLVLDGLPLWPEGNWSSEPSLNAQGSISLVDRASAQPWVRRDDPWATHTLQRRHLAHTSAEIDAWRARLAYAQGRCRAFWSPDHLAPVLELAACAEPEHGYLRLRQGGALAAYWQRAAGVLILHPDGTRQLALSATLHQERGEGVLVLRSPLGTSAPAGSRVLRLQRWRLDHDAVELRWLSAQQLELTLTLRQLGELRGNSRERGYFAG